MSGNITGNNMQLLEAIRNRNHELVEKELKSGNSRINYPDENGNNPLHKAVRTGDKEIIHMLLKHKANIRYRNVEGKTSLHLALDLAHNFSKDDVVSILELLLKIDEKGSFMFHGAKEALTRKHRSIQAPQLKIEENYIEIWNKIKRALPEIRDNWDGTYKTLPEQKMSFKGPLFQIKLMMLIVANALDQTYQFKLGNEVKAALPFDDIVIKYGTNEPNLIRLLQLKHREDSPNNSISVDDLKSIDPKKHDFSLLKYFKYFCNDIIKKDLFKLDDRNKIENLIIITNSEFHFKKKDEISDKSQCNEVDLKWNSYLFENIMEKQSEKLLFINNETMENINIYTFDCDQIEEIEKEIREIINKKIKDIDKSIENIIIEIESDYFFGLSISDYFTTNTKNTKSLKNLSNTDFHIADDLKKTVEDLRKLGNEIGINKTIENQFQISYKKYTYKLNLTIEEHKENANTENEHISKMKKAFCDKIFKINDIIKNNFNNIIQKSQERKLYELLSTTANENLTTFIKKLKFITKFPNVDQLDDLIENQFKEEVKVIVNSCMQDYMIKELKFYDEKCGSKFYDNFNAHLFYEDLKNKIKMQSSISLDTQKCEIKTQIHLASDECSFKQHDSEID